MTKTWRRVAWFALGAMGTALFVVVLYALLQGAQTTQSIRESQVANHQLLDTINDCTKPTGKCFQRGQQQTAGAVASINRVVILAAACAVGRTGAPAQIQSQIQQCVVDGLARQRAK